MEHTTKTMEEMTLNFEQLSVSDDNVDENSEQKTNFDSDFDDNNNDCDEEEVIIDVAMTKKYINNDRMKCTKLCNSIKQHMHCYNKNCTFAHKRDEMNVQNCSYGSKCNKISYINNIATNSTVNICEFIHPIETHLSFFERIGAPVMAYPPPPPSPPSQSQPQHKSNPYASTTANVQSLAQEDEYYVRVPVELAANALEMAIKNGHKNIRIEVVY
jgi:hypothetical protein